MSETIVFLDGQIKKYEKNVETLNDKLNREKHILKMFKTIKKFEEEMGVDEDE